MLVAKKYFRNGSARMDLNAAEKTLSLTFSNGAATFKLTVSEFSRTYLRCKNGAIEEVPIVKEEFLEREFDRVGYKCIPNLIHGFTGDDITERLKIGRDGDIPYLEYEGKEVWNTFGHPIENKSLVEMYYSFYLTVFDYLDDGCQQSPYTGQI